MGDLSDRSDASTRVSFPQGFKKLALNHSVDEFEMWNLRLGAAVVSSKQELHAFFDTDFDDDPAVEVFMRGRAAQSRVFSAILISAVSDDILQRFRHSVDLKTKGLLLYRRLCELWSVQKANQPSSEELLLGFLGSSLSRTDSKSVEAFLRDAQNALQVLQASHRVPVAERLVVHHVLRQLSQGHRFSWASSIAAHFASHLRSAEVRADPSVEVPVDFSLPSLVEQVRVHVHADRPSAESTRCSVCHRPGHSAEKCYDVHPELKKSGGKSSMHAKPSVASLHVVQPPRSGHSGPDPRDPYTNWSD